MAEIPRAHLCSCNAVLWAEHATMLLWKLMMQPARMSETLGWLWGVVLSPVDLLLTRFMKESPSTEIMLCRKIR